MSNFPRVFTEILKTYKIRLVDLAPRSELSQPYLSNLKQSATRRISPEALNRLVQGLAELDVPAEALDSLRSAASRARDGKAEEGTFDIVPPFSILDVLSDLASDLNFDLPDFSNEANLVPSGSHRLLEEFPRERCLEAAADLLLRAAQARPHATRRKVFVCGFHPPDAHALAVIEASEALRSAWKRFIAAARALLKPGSSSELDHLHFGPTQVTYQLILDALTKFLGTTNYRLIDVATVPRFAEFVFAEGVGAVVITETADGTFSILEWVWEGTEEPPEVRFLRSFINTLVGPAESSQQILQTHVTERFASVASVEMYVRAEGADPDADRLLIKPAISSLYRPFGSPTSVADDELGAGEHNRFLSMQRERKRLLAARLENAAEYYVHPKNLMRSRVKEWRECLRRGRDGDEQAEVEANGICREICALLDTIRTSTRVKVGLVERDFPLTLVLVAGHTIFHEQYTASPSDAVAESSHQGLFEHLKTEFHRLYSGIDPDWRSDAEGGQQRLINHFVTDIVTTLIEDEHFGDEHWSFLRDVVHSAIDLDDEGFAQALYRRELSARKIFIVSAELPLCTIPPDTRGAWDESSTTSGRQHLLHSFIHMHNRQFDVVVTEEGVQYELRKRTWGKADGKSGSYEATGRHLEYLDELTQTQQEQFHLYVAPSGRFATNFEVVDEQYVFIETAAPYDLRTGGIAIDNKDLAKAIQTFALQRLIGDRQQETSFSKARTGVTGG